MFNFIKRLFSNNQENIKRPEHFYIDMMQYDYIVSEIYNNMIFVDVNLDTCDVKKGEHVKLMNEMYSIVNTEFNPSKENYRWRIVLVKE